MSPRERFTTSIKNILLAAFVSLAAFELFSFVATKFELLLLNDIPEVFQPRDSGFDWRTQKEAWGSWHRANATDRHRSSCFDVRYEANDFGARDTSFSYAKGKSRPRYILVGDSFAEGWGVDFNDTVQSRLENSLDIDVYNFGSDGYFGPVQYYLIYRNLAKQFDHDGVIVFFLPANDFTDNDFTLWKNSHPTWYRPYYRKADNGQYDIFYPDGAVKSELYQEARPSLPTRFLERYTYSVNTLRTVKYLLSENSIANGAYSGYFDATPAQQEAAIHFIRKIVAEAENRKVMILAIPTRADLARIRSGSSYKDQYWYRTLFSLQTANSNVDVIDMAENMPHDYADLFHRCDNHWNARGNLTAANMIADRYRASRSQASWLRGSAPVDR
jgi:hypothetical protein